MNLSRILLLSALLTSLTGGPGIHAAEFEVLDRFSVDGYTVLRSSADIPGGFFTVGASTFVVKDGKVGIGTTSPNGLLTLKSSGVGTAGGIRLIASDDANVAASISESPVTAGTGYIALTKNDVSQSAILLNGGGDSWFNTGGNVGIGLTNPANGKLVVVGTALSDAFGINNVNGSILGAGGANSYIGINDGTNTDLVVMTGATNKGNVGIGTVSPFSKLTITIPATNVISTADASNTAGLTIAGTGNLVRLQLGVGSGSIGPYGGWIQASYDNGGEAYGAEPLLLNPSGGNVGIGTAAPAVKLHIAGTDAIIIPVGTTGQRPASGVDGMLRVNTSTGKLEYFNNGGWNSIGAVAATGGTVTDVGGYRIHTFTASGTFAVTTGGNVEILVVAGGGGGGGVYGGGGGAGGLINNTAYPVTGSVSYPVTVGGGGSINNNGYNSVFDILTAIGGGRGGQYPSPSTGGSGGSGGGGGAVNPTSAGGGGTSAQGYAGGTATSTSPGYQAAGGGGAGGAGGNVSGNGGDGGAGGPGQVVSISGTAKYYAGGGGGSGYNDVGGTGGSGVGGNGASFNPNAGPTTPVANRGGGGGGGDAGGNASAGGSGIVIIRYPY